ncbi:radical SAM/SPASM domain-containing protein [Aminipila terrae]|uniref:Radical SAM protein n=1 Tax=Aminipila terrae TaxID=2697030 RepID=A0A6P1MBE6_9FIRM|nr:radical SAM/SPASM domain-containing protein [Aminipila terrae]QHI71950.1 radical SAM protein [Aminipila terrae]
MAEIKTSAGQERKILSDLVPLAVPFSVYAFVTNFCNFKCIYCGHSLGTEKMKEEYNFIHEQMTLETFKEIVDQLCHFGQKIKLFSLTGHGEPLLNQQLPQMIAYAKKKQVAERIEIISNGSLLTNQLSDKLIEAGLDCIRISLQGLNSKKYKEICGYNLDFQQYLNQLSYFYKRKGNCQLFVKIMDVALEENEENVFYEMFDNICDRMFIEQCRPVYSGVQLTEHMEVTADRYGQIHLPREVCPLCFFMLGILPNGDVKPCDSVYTPVLLGNIFKNNLQEMWNGGKLKDFQIMQLQKKRCDIKYCNVCCAPDDVSQPEDALDEKAENILGRL